MATSIRRSPIQAVQHRISGMSLRWQVIYTILAAWLVATLLADPALFVTQFIGGFFYGMILVMIALGLALILGLMGVINFAHGALFMLGAYFAFTVTVQLGLSYWAALVIAPIGVGIIGLAMELVTIRPLYDEPPEIALLLTFGLAMMFEEATRFIWGPAPKSYPTPKLLSQPVSFGFTTVPGTRLFTVAVGIVMVALTYFLILRTDFGLTIRAGVQDSEMTEIVGVNLPLRFTAMFFIGATLAGLGGVLRSTEVGLGPGMAGTFIIIVFVVIVIGGMGSFSGAIAGGLLVGWASFLGPSMLRTAANLTGVEALALQGAARVIPFLIMIVVLLDRPRGLFGEEGFLE